ncbi:hypothetical protein ACSBR2_029179 [Camellia fascicularis]
MAPYSLVYGMEVVLPIETEIPSLRVLAEFQIKEAEWKKSKIARAFNKKVNVKNLEEEDLVLKENQAPMHDPREKFKPNWIGLYIIKKIMTRGVILLMYLDGIKFTQPISIDKLKKYYP